MRVLMVTPIWPTPARPFLAPFLVEQVEHLRRDGVEVEVFDFRGGFNPRNYLGARRSLRRRHRLEDFDLIHAQFGQSGTVALPTGRRPLVVTFHGSDLHGVVNPGGGYGLRGWVLRQLSRWVARKARKIILVSRHLAQFLPRECSFETIPCGVDLAGFRPIDRTTARAEIGFADDTPLVLFGGKRDHPVKRYDLALATMSLLPTDLRAEMVGLSGVSHDLIPTYMSACDALLVTSRHEGSPTMVKEALCCDLPVVSLAVGDVEERIGGIDGCVVCRSEAPRDLAAALAGVLESRRRIDGRSAIADLDHSIVTPKLIAAYHSALAGAACR